MQWWGWVAKLGGWVVNLRVWMVKVGGWVAKLEGMGGLVGSAPACYGSTLSSNSGPSKFINGRHKHRNNQYIVARQKKYTKSMQSKQKICTFQKHFFSFYSFSRFINFFVGSRISMLIFFAENKLLRWLRWFEGHTLNIYSPARNKGAHICQLV